MLIADPLSSKYSARPCTDWSVLMNRFLGLCPLFFLMLCSLGPMWASAGPERVEAGGMVAIERGFPEKPNGYTALEFALRIDTEPGYNGRTFWATQFWIENGDVGYAGLQANSANEKRINFSIWKAIRWDMEGAGVNCGFFDHEGSGVQCWVAYPWKEGVKYVFLLKRLTPGNFQLSVRDESNGAVKNVAVIQTPNTWGGLKPGILSFLEDFAQGNEQHGSCAEVPPTSAVFFKPLANGEVSPNSSSSRTYGHCEKIARASCTAGQDCTASANMPE